MSFSDFHAWVLSFMTKDVLYACLNILEIVDLASFFIAAFFIIVRARQLTVCPTSLLAVFATY